MQPVIDPAADAALLTAEQSSDPLTALAQLHSTAHLSYDLDNSMQFVLLTTLQ